MNPNRATAVLFAILAAILATAFLRARGPDAVPATAPPDQFSSDRAIATLSEILGGDAPHPIGTAMHDLVRDRLVAHLRALRYETTIRQTFSCNAHATCAPVANIIARLPGDARADTLMISAHYDSVPAGPGASDDGIGVGSLLEIARAIRNEHFRNTILFVFTDGEEEGLLGAEAFVADPQLLRGVAAAINVENRGTSGRSYLFETSRHNRWLLPLIARSLPRPAASSFFFNLYELLPNDTDLSVFKRAGIAGINFAAIGQVLHYHTSLDDLRHVTPSTVQDHGDHMLAMTRALANTDLRQSTNEDAVFFDVLSFGLLWWPVSWTKWMAAGALVLLLIAAAIRVRDGETTAGAVTLGVASFFLTVIAGGIAGAFFAWVALLRTMPAVWVAQPGPAIAAMWLIGAATAIVCASPMLARAGFDGLFIGHALCWIAMAVAPAILLPGGAYLAVVPAMAFALCMILRVTLDLSEAMSQIMVAAVTAMLWFPIAITLYELIGRPALGVTAAVVALISTTFSPMAAVSTPMRRASVAAMYTTAAACIVMQLLIPPFTPDSPRSINVQYVDDEGAPRWLVDGLTPQLRRVAPFRLPPHNMAEWLTRRVHVFTAPAPRLPIRAPELRIVSDNREHGRQVVLQVRSMRGAERTSLIFHAPDLGGLRVNGFTPPQQPAKFHSFLADGWHAVSLRGAQQAEIEISLRQNRPIDALLIDTSYSLPPEAVPIATARDASMAVPGNLGDGTVVRRRIRI